MLVDWVGNYCDIGTRCCLVLGRFVYLTQSEFFSEHARRLSAGDLGARSGPPYGSGELLLARSFDEMSTLATCSPA